MNNYFNKLLVRTVKDSKLIKKSSCLSALLSIVKIKVPLLTFISQTKITYQLMSVIENCQTSADISALATTNPNPINS